MASKEVGGAVIPHDVLRKSYPDPVGEVEQAIRTARHPKRQTPFADFTWRFHSKDAQGQRVYQVSATLGRFRRESQWRVVGSHELFRGGTDDH